MGFTWESAIHEKTKIAEDGDSSLDDASAKICDIFRGREAKTGNTSAVRRLVITTIWQSQCG